MAIPIRKKKKHNKKKNRVSRKAGLFAAGIRLTRNNIKQINRKFTSLKNRFFLPQFLREMRKLEIGGLTGGNRLMLISDGDSCFDEFLKAIKSASNSINLETYIFNSDEVGWRIAKLLVKKALSGVEVNVVYDAVGCIGTSSSLFNYLREGGVEVIEYHPFIPWRKFWNISLRDHRKILIIDGRVAFIGGLNIGNEYAGKKYNGKNWRDTHLRIEGPAVRDIQFFLYGKLVQKRRSRD